MTCRKLVETFPIRTGSLAVLFGLLASGHADARGATADDASSPSLVISSSSSAAALHMAGSTAPNVSVTKAMPIGRVSVEEPSRPDFVTSLAANHNGSAKEVQSFSQGKAIVLGLRPSGHVTASRAEAAGTFMDFRPLLPLFSAGSLPLTGARLTSGFGMRLHPVLRAYMAHNGVDMAAPFGTPVKATSDGIVSRASWFGNYGLFVAVNHAGGTQSRYAHLSRLNVAAGQRVKGGDIIGFVGSTGRSTGPHLHYELRVNGQAVNPINSRRK